MSGTKSSDPFVKVRDATLAHRAKHGCSAYPYGNGPLLGAIAAAVGARRILELGTALGYTSLSFSHGAPQAHIDTVERDGEHVELARAHIASAKLDKRITVHEGDFADILPSLSGDYDVAFFDGHTPVASLHKTLRDCCGWASPPTSSTVEPRTRFARRCSTVRRGIAPSSMTRARLRSASSVSAQDERQPMAVDGLKT